MCKDNPPGTHRGAPGAGRGGVFGAEQWIPVALKHLGPRKVQRPQAIGSPLLSVLVIDPPVKVWLHLSQRRSFLTAEDIRKEGLVPAGNEKKLHPSHCATPAGQTRLRPKFQNTKLAQLGKGHGLEK